MSRANTNMDHVEYYEDTKTCQEGVNIGFPKVLWVLIINEIQQDGTNKHVRKIMVLPGYIDPHDLKSAKVVSCYKYLCCGPVDFLVDTETAELADYRAELVDF